MGYLFTQCFAYVAQGTAKKIFGGLPSENPAWPTFSLRFPLANVVSLKFLLLCIEFSLVKKKKKKTPIFAHNLFAVVISATSLRTVDCRQNLAFPGM